MAGDGDWRDAADWRFGTYPDIRGNAQISLPGPYTVTSSTDNAANTLTLTATAAILAIDDGTTFEIGGTRVSNRGSIALGSGGAGASLVFDVDARLVGTGTLTLSDSTGNAITQGAFGAVTLTNRSTIEGAGQIGLSDHGLTLVNQSVIDADQSLALVIDTGNTLLNTGTLEATGGGGLTIMDDLSNLAMGLLANGGNITVAGAVTGRGAATIDAATIEFEAASSANVNFFATTGQLKLDDASAFTGTVAGLANGPGDTIDFTGISFASVTGHFKENGEGTKGKLTLSDGTNGANIGLLGQYVANFTTTAPPSGYTGFVLADDGSASHGTLLSYSH
jgi:hypothetical protein